MTALANGVAVDPLASAALDYAARGWRVVPCHRIVNGACSCGREDCGSPGKHPRTKNGLHDATTDADAIRDWWRTWTRASVAIVTGAESGLVVIDVDGDTGRESLVALECEHGELPATVEAVTGSGGRHYLFRHPGASIRNRQGLRPSIDVRGDGGYIIAPPSNHISGGVYRWDEGQAPGETELAELPAWLLNLLTAEPTKEKQVPANLQEPIGKGSGHDRLIQRGQQYVAKAAAASQPGRNNAAFNLAGNVAALADGGDRLSEREIFELLRPWNLRNNPPLNEDELQTCVRSAIENGTPRDDKPAEAPRGDGGANPYRRESIRYQRISSAELAGGAYSLDYLIDGVLVAGQPCIIAGPQKTLKTSFIIDAAVSLAAGGCFLGKFRVPRACRVAVMSGESGLATIQETAKRVCVAAGRWLDQLNNLVWSPDLPKFGDAAHLDALEQFLVADEIEVLFVDPAYLAMPGDDAGNLMKQGDLLRGVSSLCQRLGVTLVLAHHTKKNTGRDAFDTPELSDIAWSGFPEFARQWWLLGRRERYEPGTGDHKLWLSIGGSAGHGGLWAVDVAEGVRSETTERQWSVEVRPASEARSEAEKGREDRRELERNERAATRLANDKAMIVNTLTRLGEPATGKTIRDHAGMRSDRFTPAVAELLREGIVEACEVIKCNRITPYEGFRLKDLDIPL